jgi:2-amino-4-hydroxy-6-hydroxymethyldihydropteridine diphosphokinase
MSHHIYLALGSNLGDREANLRAAREAMPPAVRLHSNSPIYETPPWGILDQPVFLNQVVEGSTYLPPAGLLAYLKGLEVQLGRTRTVRNGPRVIDLDILFYDDLVFTMTGLTIPHPRISERAFVLVPLADLAPDLVHPVEKKTIQELLGQVDRSGIERYPASSAQKITPVV